jgi:general secretion pathway protein K
MTESKSRRLVQSQNDGFIVVAVLWILVGLAVLATVFSVFIANSAMSSRISVDQLQGETLVAAALELTVYQRSVNVTPTTRGAFKFSLGEADVTVDFVSEAARVDLNAAPRNLLAGLFSALGADPGSANQYADRIVGWRTPPGPYAEDGEESLYKKARLSYSPRGGPFAHVNELWLLPGLPPSLVERSLPYVTIFSGRPDINVLDASPQVIAALPGLSTNRLNAFLALRNKVQPDWQSALEALGPNQTGVTTTGSDSIRIFVHMNFRNGARFESEVVILPEKSGAPFRVLSWLDSPPVERSREQTGSEIR